MIPGTLELSRYALYAAQLDRRFPSRIYSLVGFYFFFYI